MRVGQQHTHVGYHNAAGERIPNVTTVAKLIQSPEGLVHWAYQCGVSGIDYREARDEAATAGHLCHGMIEFSIRGKLFVPNPDVAEETLGLAQRGYEAFQSWQSSTKFVLVGSEQVVISERYQYGGRLDCVASVLGELCIVDWKTSSSRRPYESWLPQIAAYRQAWNELHPQQQIQSGHLMQLVKQDAGFSHHYFPPETMGVGWRAFLACLELYKMKKEVSKLL